MGALSETLDLRRRRVSTVTEEVKHFEPPYFYSGGPKGYKVVKNHTEFPLLLGTRVEVP